MGSRVPQQALTEGQRRRNTRQRSAIEEAFAQCRDFVSAQDLHVLLTKAGMQAGLTTVYRVLRELETSGHSDVVRDASGERLYRPRTAGEHRHYLICRCCARSWPVESRIVEDWTNRIAVDNEFTAVEHTVELTGICARCRPHTDHGEPACGGEHDRLADNAYAR